MHFQAVTCFLLTNLRSTHYFKVLIMSYNYYLVAEEHKIFFFYKMSTFLFKNVCEKIAVQLKSHGKSEIARN